MFPLSTSSYRRQTRTTFPSSVTPSSSTYRANKPAGSADVRSGRVPPGSKAARVPARASAGRRASPATGRGPLRVVLVGPSAVGRSSPGCKRDRRRTACPPSLFEGHQTTAIPPIVLLRGRICRIMDSSSLSAEVDCTLNWMTLNDETQRRGPFEIGIYSFRLEEGRKFGRLRGESDIVYIGSASGRGRIRQRLYFHLHP